MEPSGMRQPNVKDKSRHPAEPVPRLFWTLEETAVRLGLSVRSFFVLREKHPLYAPDGSRTIIDDPKKDMPLWSDDLVRLIAFARSISSQGVRQLSDDEAFKVRNGLSESRRREYLTFAE